LFITGAGGQEEEEAEEEEDKEEEEEEEEGRRKVERRKVESRRALHIKTTKSINHVLSTRVFTCTTAPWRPHPCPCRNTPRSSL